MPAKWADVLAPGSAVREEFEKLLSQRIEQDFEPEDELNSCVLDALLEVEDKESLNAELQEVFEDQAASISEWCWEALQQLTVREKQPSAPGTPATPPDSSPAADEQQNEQQAQQVRRAPIRFNLESSAPETAPKKASDDKAQQLGGRKQAVAQQPAQPPPANPPAAVQQPSRAEQQPAKAAGGSGSAGTRLRGAPAASARLLHMTGLIRSAAGNAGSGVRENRVRGRQQDQREQQPRAQEQSRSPQQQHQQQRIQQRKRALDELHGPEAGRSEPSASRRGPASVVAGAGSMFRNAMEGLKSGGRSQDPAPQQQQPQQQPTGGTSVFARIAKDDLARLGVPQPQPQPQQQQQQQQPADPKQAPASRQQGTRQQPNQQQGSIDGLPKSLQGRLGFVPGRPAAAAAAQGPSPQDERPKPSPSAAPSSIAAGAKRKADAAPPAAVAAAATAPKAVAPSSAAAAAQQQDPQQGAPAKKTRTAAPAAGSKEAELAALRTQLEARQAEVLRLKQAQESDQVSVAVFGVSPRVPDTVLMAHFRSCAQSCGANIRRCTMLAGRFPPHVTAPGAYVEFEGMGGDAAMRAKAAHQAVTNALQLSGSMLLDQKITVVRKADWQANQAKGQRVYTAARAGAVQPVGAGTRSWRGPSSGAAAATAGGAASAVKPSPGVAES